MKTLALLVIAFGVLRVFERGATGGSPGSE